MIRWALAALLALSACGKAKPEPAPAAPPADVVQTWDAAQDRLLSIFAPDGFVVSVDQAGQPRSQGDSLIFTGIALASMDCAHGARLADALERMLRATGGQLYRHPSLPDQVSLDGALGFYRGIAHRVVHCGEAARWAPLIALHLKQPALNVAAGVKLAAPFTYVRDLLAARLGLAPTPDPARQATLETAVAGWAEGVKLTRGACFRVHLGLQSLQTVEALGGRISASGRDGFCGATAGLDLPTTNGWCGRGGLTDYLATYTPNQWQYRHQRCAGWEKPDGAGMQQPGVDYLRALADVYSFVF